MIPHFRRIVSTEEQKDWNEGAERGVAGIQVPDVPSVAQHIQLEVKVELQSVSLKFKIHVLPRALCGLFHLKGWNLFLYVTPSKL